MHSHSFPFINVFFVCIHLLLIKMTLRIAYYFKHFILKLDFICVILCQRCDLCMSEGSKVRYCVVPGVCSIRWGTGSISQRGGVGSQTSRAAAQSQSKTACYFFMLDTGILNSKPINKQSLIWHFPSSLQEIAALEEATSSQTKKPETCPNSNYKDKYSHLIGTSAAKDAAHTLEANRTYGCGECRTTPGRLWPAFSPYSHADLIRTLFPLPVPVANKRDTRSIEEAMNEIRAKKRQKQEDDTVAHGSSSWVRTSPLCVCMFVGAHASKYCITLKCNILYFTKGIIWWQ